MDVQIQNWDQKKWNSQQPTTQRSGLTTGCGLWFKHSFANIKKKKKNQQQTVSENVLFWTAADLKMVLSR